MRLRRHLDKNLERLKRIIFPTLVVLVATASFAYGSHAHRTQRWAQFMADSQLKPNAAWMQEARNDGKVQQASLGRSRVAASSGDDFSDFFESDSPYTTFQYVYELLKQCYVDPIPSDAPLAHGASAALLASLDEPNSRFIEPNEYKALSDQDNGIYQGSGINFLVRKNILRKKTDKDTELVSRDLTVVSVAPGSPADKVGIRTGDVITEINHQWVRSYDLFDYYKNSISKISDRVDQDKQYIALEKKLTAGIALAKAQSELNLDSSQPLLLSIHRSGVTKPIVVSLNVKSPTTLETVKFSKLDDSTGYIHIAAFNNLTVSEFDKALAGLSSVKRLVLDLRNCPGGQVDGAIDVASAFAKNADIGQILIRDNKAKTSDSSLGFGSRSYEMTSKNMTTGITRSYSGKVVVLIDGGTANVAEMLAEFLRDRLGCRIVGAPSFGDASVQTLYPLSDQSAFVLTTGVFETDLGKSFNLTGIEPDEKVADSPEKTGTDPVIAKAESVLDLPLLKAQASQNPTLNL